MIKIAICDDEPQARSYLASLIRAQPYACQIVEYSRAEERLSELWEADLLFLDIELAPGSPDGMALARKLRERAGGRQPVIIFVSGYERYVFDAFDVGAFQYLLKPVEKEKFAQVFARAAAQIEGAGKAPPRCLRLRFADTSRTIPLDSIYFIESSNHKVLLHLADGVFASYAKLRDLEAELGEGFFRVHKGYLVNLSQVRGYSKSQVSLANGEEALLSKYKYQDFVKAYLRFLKKGAGL